jgi:hypothetical protein
MNTATNTAKAGRHGLYRDVSVVDIEWGFGFELAQAW